MKRVAIVVGARPNFMKAAPLVRALSCSDEMVVHLVHTGQHYDECMSGSFFESRGLDDCVIVKLNPNMGSPGIQLGSIIALLWRTFGAARPDLVIVVGDVNSTLAAAIVTKQMNIPLAHVESGLRSFDLTMPEEINRIMVDSVSDLCFCTEDSALTNLEREGKNHEQVFLVGNVMIDSLVEKMKTLTPSLQALALEPPFILCTLHRPANVDDEEKLVMLVDAINEIGKQLRMRVLMPLHPRTDQALKRSPVTSMEFIRFMPPFSYDDMLYTMSLARMVVTDSGGIQEETTFLRTPCVTLRDNTERPVTISYGTNRLAGTKSKEQIVSAALAASRMSDVFRRTLAPIPGWDGHAAERIAEVIFQFLREEA